MNEDLRAAIGWATAYLGSGNRVPRTPRYHIGVLLAKAEAADQFERERDIARNALADYQKLARGRPMGTSDA